MARVQRRRQRREQRAEAARAALPAVGGEQVSLAAARRCHLAAARRLGQRSQLQVRHGDGLLGGGGRSGADRAAALAAVRHAPLDGALLQTLGEGEDCRQREDQRHQQQRYRRRHRPVQQHANLGAGHLHWRQESCDAEVNQRSARRERVAGRRVHGERAEGGAEDHALREAHAGLRRQLQREGEEGDVQSAAADTPRGREGGDDEEEGEGAQGGGGRRLDGRRRGGLRCGGRFLKGEWYSTDDV
mmetsp:Transcript_40176/g.126088  ORF Transcript_40176/g.126088 Transcript_40176/m.126088 type:complete len:245 (+) Transcript_40176:371-1105(+)